MFDEQKIHIKKINFKKKKERKEICTCYWLLLLCLSFVLFNL